VPLHPETSPVRPGDVLAGRYRVDRVIGVGGMGVVVAATHLELLEPRAIKLMLPRALASAEAVERFLREARASSRLKGERVARVHDVGRLGDGAPFIVMEYLEGQDLGAIVKQRGALPVVDAVGYVMQACEALAEAHANGIVHRDVKPANLFVALGADGSPIVKVLDFGVSKLGDTVDGELTKTDVLLGSPFYMSPEQMDSSRSVDPRADVWSLGVILYQLVTGRLPFRGQAITEVVREVLLTTPKPPSALAPGLPPALDAAVMRCLERDLDRRFGSVVELAEALAPLVPGDGPVLLERVICMAAPSTSGLRATGTRLPRVSLPMPTPTSTPISGSTVVVPRGVEVPGAPPALGGDTGAWGTTASLPSLATRRRRVLTIGALGLGALFAAGALAVSSSGGGRPAASARPAASSSAAPALASPAAVSAPAPASASAPPPPTEAPTATSTSPLASAVPAKTAAPVARPRPVDPFGMGRK
jgi:serine/threonine-protein kinase